MKWYWYSARNNELFLDVDDFPRHKKHIEHRLQGAIDCEKLNVHHIESMPSNSPDHQHIIITLNETMLPEERFVWEIILRGDIYRACCNLMRLWNDIENPDILIRKEPFKIRTEDNYCFCDEKHTAKIMENCPVAKFLRGEGKAKGFFGKPTKEIKIKI